MRKIRNIFTILFLAACFYVVTGCTFTPFTGTGTEADTKNPKLTVTSPKTNTATAAMIRFTGTCSDNKKLDKLIMYVDGSEVSRINAHSTFTIDYDASALPDKTYRFDFVLTDKNDNKAQETINLLLDKTAPQFELYSPLVTAGSVNRVYSSIDFTGSLSDSGSGLNLEDTSINRLIIHKKDASDDVLWSFRLSGGTFILSDNEITSEMDGEYTIVLHAEDLAGNVFDYSGNIFLSSKENTPVLVLQIPDATSTTPLTTDRDIYVQGYATDNNAIARVEYNFLNEDLTPVYSTYFTIETNYQFAKVINLQALGTAGDIQLTDGSYWITFRAVDDEGVYSTEKKVKFHKNSSLPTVKILDSASTPTGATPMPLTYTNADFNIEVSTSQSAAVLSYYIQQGNITTATTIIQNPTTADTPYTGTIDISAIKETYGITDGAITIVFSAYPVSDPTLVSYITREIFIDETPPVINITSHTDMQIVNGGIVIAGTASDNVSLDATLDIYNPVPSINTWKEFPSASSWQYEISKETDTGSIEALYGLALDETSDTVFTVRATDKAGNETTDTVHLIVSPASDYPELYRYMPAGSGFYASGSMTVYFRIGDDDYPAQNLYATFELLDEGIPLPAFTTQFDSSSTGFPNCTKIVDVSTLTDGKSYNVRLSGKDWRGKTAQPIEFTFTADHQAPLITVTTPTNLTNTYCSNSIKISGTITDNKLINNAALYDLDHNGNTIGRYITLTGPVAGATGNVYSFNVTLNASTADTGIGGTDFTWGNDIWGNSSKIFQIRATDQSGLSASTQFNINIDNNQPVVTVTRPQINDIFGHQLDGFLSITGGVNDTPPAGIAFTQDFANLKIDLYKGSILNQVIKEYGTQVSDGDQVTGSLSTFTYKWKIDTLLIDDDDYSIIVYTKDNAGNNETAPVTIALTKNSKAPLISDIRYTKRNYYGAQVPMTIDVNAPNGIDYIRILADGAPVQTIDYDAASVTSLSDANIMFDTATAGLVTGTKYAISLLIGDGTGLEMTYPVDNFTIDTVSPVIATDILYYTKDYTGAITSYSTYLRFTGIGVTDNLSLENYEATYTMGTTSGGSEIAASSKFSQVTRTGIAGYTAKNSNYIDLSAVTGDVYITVKANDNAGNVTTRIFTISRSADADSLFTAGFASGDYICDTSDGQDDDTITFSGMISSTCNKLWITIDNGDETAVNGYSTGNTTFTHSITAGTLTNGEHTIRLRANRNSDGTQQSDTFTMYADNFAPVVTINDLSGALTGTVTFSGTYNDNNADLLSTKGDAGIVLTINGTNYTVPDANIVRKTQGESWSWSYSLDVTSLSGSYVVSVSAVDIAGTTAADTTTITAQ